jgi:hypothetical protein
VLARSPIGIPAIDALGLALCHEAGCTATLESFQSRLARDGRRYVASASVQP